MPYKLCLLDKYEEKKSYLFITSFAIQQMHVKEQARLISISKWIKIKCNCPCFVRRGINPYTFCQRAVVKEGSISREAGSRGLAPEGYGTGLQNVYNKIKQQHKKKYPKPSKRNTTNLARREN